MVPASKGLSPGRLLPAMQAAAAGALRAFGGLVWTRQDTQMTANLWPFEVFWNPSSAALR